MGNEKPYKLNAGKNGGINLGGEKSRMTAFKFAIVLVATVGAFSILNLATSGTTEQTSELRARTEIALCHMGYGKNTCSNLESDFQSKFGKSH